MKHLLIALLILPSFSFAQSSQQEIDWAAIQKLSAATHALATTDLSCSEDSDCLVMPMGTTACGSPSDYIMTSRNNWNLKEVRKLSRLVTLKEHQFNVRYDVISTCEYLMPPEVTCRENKCTQSASSNLGGSIINP